MFSLLAMATHILANADSFASMLDKDGSGGGGGAKVRQIRIPGDVIIGGVFPVHQKASGGDEPCGVHRVEAMLYALDMINAQPEFLRGYKLGALILDSCSNPAYALNQSLDFVRDMIGSTDANEYQCSDGSEPDRITTAEKNVVAVVGGSYSSVTVQIANLLRLFRIVQVSPASTNADLSDKSRFEFFARTVPSDNYQARAMVDIALHFNWTYVSLVYSADEYGELGADAFKKEARKANVCIAIEERISTKRNELPASIDNLVKKLQPDKEVGARVVILFVGTEYVPELMQQTQQRMQLTAGTRKRKKIIWLASEGWDRNNEAYTAGNRSFAAEGAIVLMLASQPVPSFEEYFLSLQPGMAKFERNQWLRELWQHKFGCRFDLPAESKVNRCEGFRQTRDNFSPDDKIQFVIDAVYAIAHGLQAMKEKLCPNDTIETSWISRHAKVPEICGAIKHIDGSDFYQNYLLNVKFTDLVGKRFRFSPEGDGPAFYTILNYQPVIKESKSRPMTGGGEKGNYVVVGNWSEEQLHIDESLMFWNSLTASQKPPVPISLCSLPCKLGYRKQLIKDELCCWACAKCEDYEYLINETTCLDCGVGKWPTASRNDCYDIAMVNLRYIRWQSSYAIVPIIFAVFGIGATLATIGIYLRYHETPVVKASGRELSYILLISMIMCYVMTFVLVARPTPLVCAIKRTGIGFAFSCLYAAMLVKTNRIARIFGYRGSAQPLACISPISQLLLTALLAGMQLVGSLLWLLIVPPGTRQVYPTRDAVVLTCNVPDHHFLYSLTYDAGLIVLCTVYAIKTRKVPENYNETKFIGFSMYTTCVVWLSWIFFFFGTGSDFQIQTTSLCISISMSANVALACIFSPKLWIILFEKHKNVRKQDGGTLKRSNYTPTATYEDTTNATQYTSLLADQRRRSSHTQPSPSVTSNAAGDTFL